MTQLEQKDGNMLNEKLIRKFGLRRRNGNSNHQDIYFERPVNHRDLSLLQTVKKFVDQGYSPHKYNSKDSCLYLVNESGDTLTMAEVPGRVAALLTGIQENHR